MTMGYTSMTKMTPISKKVKNGISYIYRAMEITRWQIFGKALPDQTIADHSWGVCIILARISDDLALDAYISHNLQRYGLIHDTEEIYTGDMAHCIKKFVSVDGDQMRQIMHQRTSPAPGGLNMSFLDMDLEIGCTPKHLFKIADVMESAGWLNRFVDGTAKAHGSRASKVLKGTVSRLEVMIAEVPSGEARDRLHQIMFEILAPSDDLFEDLVLS